MEAFLINLISKRQSSFVSLVGFMGKSDYFIDRTVCLDGKRSRFGQLRVIGKTRT